MPDRYSHSDNAPAQVPRSAGLERKQHARSFGEILRGALAFTVWAYALFIVAVCGLLWLFTDRWSVATAIAFGPRWVLSLPLLLLVPAVGLFHRRLLVVVIVVLVLAAGPLMGWNLPWGRISWTSGPSLRIMTCNLNGQKSDLTALIDLVADVRPDVVTLQECHNQPIDTLWFSDWHVRQVGSLTVASRFPVRVVEAMHNNLASTPAVQCMVDTPWSAVSVVNLHLPSPRTGMDPDGDSNTGRDTLRILSRSTEFREAASEAANRKFRHIRGPLIVAGDFNLPTASRIYQRFWSTFNNAFSVSGFGLGHSKTTELNGWCYGTRIDHILTGKGWEARRCWIGRNIGSDHLPVIADLVWTGSRGNDEAARPVGESPCAPSMVEIDPAEFDALHKLLNANSQDARSSASPQASGKELANLSTREDSAAGKSSQTGQTLDVHCRYITLDIDGWYKLPAGRSAAALRRQVGSSQLQLRADDCASLVPERAANGTSYAVDPAVAEKIVRFCLVDGSRAPAAPWDAEHLRCYRMSLAVEQLDEEVAHLRLDGEALLATAPNPALADRGYEVRLLGYLTCDLDAQTLARFDVVAVGDYWSDGARHRGVAPGRPLLGVALRLADETETPAAASPTVRRVPGDDQYREAAVRWTASSQIRPWPEVGGVGPGPNDPRLALFD